jgi:hypothetical protein
MQEIALVTRLPVLLVIGLLLGAAAGVLLPEAAGRDVTRFCIVTLCVAGVLWTLYSVIKWVSANNRHRENAGRRTSLDLLSYYIGGTLQPASVLAISAGLLMATFMVSGLVGWASAFLEAGWFSLWVGLESTAKTVEGVRFIPVLASPLLAFLLTGCLVWLIVLCSTRVELPEIAQILGKDIKKPGPSFLYPSIGLTMFAIWVMYNQDWGRMMLFIREGIPKMAITPVGMTVLVAVILFAFPTFRRKERLVLLCVICGCILFLGMSVMAAVKEYIDQIPLAGPAINILLKQTVTRVTSFLRCKAA